MVLLDIRFPVRVLRDWQVRTTAESQSNYASPELRAVTIPVVVGREKKVVQIPVDDLAGVSLFKPLHEALLPVATCPRVTLVVEQEVLVGRTEIRGYDARLPLQLPVHCPNPLLVRFQGHGGVNMVSASVGSQDVATVRPDDQDKVVLPFFVTSFTSTNTGACHCFCLVSSVHATNT